MLTARQVRPRALRVGVGVGGETCLDRRTEPGAFLPTSRSPLKGMWNMLGPAMGESP